jgi:O-antigen ligase
MSQQLLSSDLELRPKGLEIALIALAIGTAVSIVTGNSVVVILAGIIAYFFAAANPLPVLCVLVAILPLAPNYPTNVEIFRDYSLLFRYVLFAGVFVNNWKNGRSIKQWLFRDRVHWLIIAYVVFVTVTLLRPGHTTFWGLKTLIRWYSDVALAFAITGSVYSIEQEYKVLKTLAYSTVVLIVFGYLQFAVDGYTGFYFWLYPSLEDAIEPWSGRVTSFLNHFNSLATYINLLFPLALAAAVLAKDRILRKRCQFLAIGLVILLFLTQSRGGIIAFGLSLVLGILMLIEKWKTKVTMLVAVLLIVSLSFGLLVAFSDRFGEVDAFTKITRLRLYFAAWNMFTANPVMGVGFGNFRESYDPSEVYAEVGFADAHNLYLKLLAETGIIGFSLFMGMCATFAFIAYRQFRGRKCLLDAIIGFGFFAGLATVLVHGMVDYVFEVSRQSGALLWLLIGMLLTNRRRIAAESEKSPMQLNSGTKTIL